MQLKQQKEMLALERIISFIPNETRFERIFTEYEKRETREAEFAIAVDCLDACMRNLNDDAKNRNDGFTEQLIRQKYMPNVSKFEITLLIFESIIEKLLASEKL